MGEDAAGIGPRRPQGKGKQYRLEGGKAPDVCRVTGVGASWKTHVESLGMARAAPPVLSASKALSSLTYFSHLFGLP